MVELDDQGFTIIEDYLSAAQLQRFRDGLAPYLGTYRGRNSFEGRTTERIYTLAGRGACLRSPHRTRGCWPSSIR